MPASAGTIVDQARDTIAAHAMLTLRDRVLVGVSGGPDSVALLHVLRALKYEVIIAHLDHTTRNGQSADDGAFVAELGAALGVPVVVEKRAIESEAASQPESFEQAARMARYLFFGLTAKAHGCKAIATGHNADDVAETVLWRLVRGTSLDGIAGIPPVRPLGTAQVVRPLIACTREAILAYLADNGIAYRVDPSNLDPKFLRNRIRHELMPLLTREFNPSVRDALVRLATLARDDTTIIVELLDTFLGACVSATDGVDRARFANGSAALQRRAVQTVVWRRGLDRPFERIEAARQFILNGRTGAKLDIGGAMLINTRTHTRFVHAKTEPDTAMLRMPGETTAFGKRFTARAINGMPPESIASYCTPSRQVFDADAIGGAVRVRARRPGDRFTPLGMDGTRKLQDYFTDAGVASDDRDWVPLIESGGRIAWIVGGPIDAAFAVRADSRRMIEINVEDASDAIE